jgi:hypothetical protein
MYILPAKPFQFSHYCRASSFVECSGPGSLAAETTCTDATSKSPSPLRTRLRHTFCRQPHGREFLCVLQSRSSLQNNFFSVLNFKLRPKRRLEDNIKMDLREIGWGGMDWIHLAQYRDQWRSLVKKEINLRVS